MSTWFDVSSCNGGSFNSDGSLKLTVHSPISLKVDGAMPDVAVKGDFRFSFGLSGSVATHHVDGGMFGSYDVPNAPPDVHVSLTLRNVSFSFSVTDPKAVAQALWDAVGPRAWHSAGQLAGAATNGFGPDLEQQIARLANAAGTDGFPFWDALPDDGRNAVTSKLQGAINGLSSGFRAQFTQSMPTELGRVQNEVVALGRRLVNNLDAHLRDAAALLQSAGVQFSDWGRALAASLGQAFADGRALVDDGSWYLDQQWQNQRGQVSATLGDWIARLRGGWASRADEVRQLLDHAQQIGFDDWKHLVAAVQTQLGDALAGAGQLFTDVLGWARDRASLAAGQVGALLGGAIARLLSAQKDLGGVLGPFFAAARLAKQDAIDLLRHLGPADLTRTVCHWLHDNWDKAKAAFTDAAEEIKTAIDRIIGYAEGVSADFAAKVARLLGVLSWARDLPQAFANLEGAGREVQELAKKLKSGDIGAAWLAGACKGGHLPTQALLDAIQKSEVYALLSGVADQTVRLCNQVAADATGKTFPDDIPAVMADLQVIADFLESVVFAGGAGEGAYTIGTSAFSLVPDALVAEGGKVVAGEDTESAAVADAGNILVGVPVPGDPNPHGYLRFFGAHGPVILPEPTVMGGAQLPPWEGNGVEVPGNWDGPSGALALCHLAELWVLDMRYHMPYGDVIKFRVADLDNDGFVRDWEIAAVRHHVGGHHVALDCDGDGTVTAEDVELALEQKQGYVNGLMWRRTTATVGFFLSVQPIFDWYFVGLCDLADESIAEKLRRDGLLIVYTGQLSLPYYDFLTGAARTYKLRMHTEERVFADTFLMQSARDVPFPFPNFSERYDYVFRGGDEGRDFQLYLTCEPYNLMARTFTFKAHGYLRALTTGSVIGPVVETGLGLMGKGDCRLTLLYECNQPLIATLAQWEQIGIGVHDDIVAGESSPLGKFGYIGWRILNFFGDQLGLTRLLRAIVRLIGPYFESLFGWTDPDGRVRGMLAWVRERVLLAFTPGKTWTELRNAVRGVQGLDSTQRDRVISALNAQQGTTTDATTAFDAPKARQALAAAGVSMPESLSALFDPAALVLPPGQASGAPAWSGAGVTLTRVVPRVWGWRPRPEPGAPPPDRTEPKKSFYGTIVRFGPGAAIYNAPVADDAFKIHGVPENGLAVVQCNFVLTGAGDWWTFVRTATRRYGWVRAGFALDVLADHDEMIDDERSDSILRSAPILAVSPSSPETVDDSDALTHAELLLRDGDSDAIDLRNHVRDWIELRFLDQTRGRLRGLGLTDAALPMVWSALTNRERQVFWQQVVAEVKAAYYFVKISEQLVQTVAPPLVNWDIGGAVAAIGAILGNSATSFMAVDQKVAAVQAMPALADALVSAIAVGIKLFQIASSFDKTHFKQLEKKAEDVATQLGNVASAAMDKIKPALSMLAHRLADQLRSDFPDWLPRESHTSSSDDQLLEGATDGKDPAPSGDGASSPSRFHVEKGAKIDPDKQWAGFTGSIRAADGGPTLSGSAGVGIVGDSIEFGADAAVTESTQSPSELEDQANKQKAKDDNAQQGSFSFDIGKDKVTISWSFEGGGGGGAGESEVSASASGNVRVHAALLKVPLALMSAQSVGVLTRLMLRVAYHMMVDFTALQDEVNGWLATARHQTATKVAGAFQGIAVMLFAIGEALHDIIDDHPDWVASFLELCTCELNVDVSAQVVGALGGHCDARGEVKGRVWTSLGTILMPVVDILCSDASPDEAAASAADRIYPHLDFSIDDHIGVRLGGVAASIDVDTRGPLASGKFSIPEGSTWRRYLQDVAKFLAEVGQVIKRAAAPQSVPDTRLGPWLAHIDALDDAVKQNLLIASESSGPDGGIPAAAASVGGAAASFVMQALTGANMDKAPSDPPDAQATADAKAALITRPVTVGTEITPGHLVTAEPNGQLYAVSIYLDDTQRANLYQKGFHDPPTRPPAPKIESLRYDVTLPSAPDEVGWHHIEPANQAPASGIIAGFVDRSAAVAFASARNTQWLGSGGRPADVWSARDRFYVWLETGMADRLVAASCGLPSLSLDGATLHLDFDQMPAGAVADAAPAILSGLQPVTRTTVWQIVLVNDASRNDYRLLAGVMAGNRP